jgi:hypothetical protein
MWEAETGEFPVWSQLVVRTCLKKKRKKPPYYHFTMYTGSRNPCYTNCSNNWRGQALQLLYVWNIILIPKPGHELNNKGKLQANCA